MYLIDEEDDLSVAFGDFLYDAFKPLLEFALIFRAGNQRTHIEGEHLAVLEILRDLSVDYLGRDAFGYGRLAHTRLADEDRVVFRAPAQYLKHAPYLLVPPDDGIEFSFCRSLVEVYGIFT